MKFLISKDLKILSNNIPEAHNLSHLKYLYKTIRIPLGLGPKLLPDIHYCVHSLDLKIATNVEIPASNIPTGPFVHNKKVDKVSHLPGYTSIVTFKSLVSFLSRFTNFPISCYIRFYPQVTHLFPFNSPTIFNLHRHLTHWSGHPEIISDFLMNTVTFHYNENDFNMSPFDLLFNYSKLQLHFFANPLLGSSDFSSRSVPEVLDLFPYLATCFDLDLLYQYPHLHPISFIDPKKQRLHLKRCKKL